MIMKKLLLFIFTLLLPLVASAYAYGLKIDGICYNLYDYNHTAEVIYSTDSKYSGDVVIPATVTFNYNDNQYSVTSIGESAFYWCTGLTSVTIPNSVTSIGNNAFDGCTGLTFITIPNSVTTIGYNAFDGCTGLTSITIPNSVTTIEYNAFYRCGVTKENFNNQSNITPSGLIVCDVRTESGFCIKDNALVKYLGKERTITIPNSVTSIGDEAFYRCSELTSITIPNSVTTIGAYTFYGCTGLTSITIPNSVTTIGAFTFYGCTGLTSITIPNSVTNIGNWAFNECRGLTSITIPNSVTSIGQYAFSRCTGLTSVSIPSSVTNIEHEAFYGCSGLTSITIPNSVTNIGIYAFYNCKNLKTVYCYATKLPETSENTFGNYDDNQHINNYATINYATLYVPASAINEYKATAPWSWFGTILPIEDATTQIDAASTNDYNIITNGNDIIVKSDADGEKVSIYTFSGQLIGTTAIRNGSAVINTNLKPGSVAIVMIGQNTYKIRLD